MLGSLRNLNLVYLFVKKKKSQHLTVMMRAQILLHLINTRGRRKMMEEEVEEEMTMEEKGFNNDSLKLFSFQISLLPVVQAV